MIDLAMNDDVLATSYDYDNVGIFYIIFKNNKRCRVKRNKNK